MTDKRKLEQLEESLNFEKKKEAKMLEELSKRIEQVREEEKIIGEELGRSNRVVTLSESDFFSRSSKNNPTFGNFFDAVAEIDNRGLPKEE